jgi:hypothetical protein
VGFNVAHTIHGHHLTSPDAHARRKLTQITEFVDGSRSALWVVLPALPGETSRNGNRPQALQLKHKRHGRDSISSPADAEHGYSLSRNWAEEPLRLLSA